ncbi:nucleotide modification protein [Stenotrophomonas phage Sonora]|nr:nucleotide modification protein [Stenotrophomonas phage Sonora]
MSRSKRTYLSDSIRDSIRIALIDRAVLKHVEANMALLKQIGTAVYEEHHKGVDFSKIKGVPSEFLLLTDSITVKVPRTDGYAGTKSRSFGLTDVLPTTAHHRGNTLEKPSAGLLKLIKKLQAEEATLSKKKDELKSSIRAQMAGVTTVEALISRWPEVKPFAQPYLNPPSAPLPVVIPAALNKALDLPVGTEKPKPADKKPLPAAAVQRITKARKAKKTGRFVDVSTPKAKKAARA